MPEVSVSKQRPAPVASRLSDILEPFPSRFFGLSPFSPFTLVRQFNEQMEQFMRGNGSQNASMDWVPSVDVHRSNGSLVVSAELPGLKKEDVKVEVTDELITIEGERKHEEKIDREGYHRCERSYGHFYRAIPLPEGAKADQAKAELKEGVLKVTLPVAATEKKTKQIPISA